MDGAMWSVAASVGVTLDSHLSLDQHIITNAEVRVPSVVTRIGVPTVHMCTSAAV